MNQRQKKKENKVKPATGGFEANQIEVNSMKDPREKQEQEEWFRDTMGFQKEIQLNEERNKKSQRFSIQERDSRDEASSSLGSQRIKRIVFSKNDSARVKSKIRLPPIKSKMEDFSIEKE